MTARSYYEELLMMLDYIESKADDPDMAERMVKPSDWVRHNVQLAQIEARAYDKAIIKAQKDFPTEPERKAAIKALSDRRQDDLKYRIGYIATMMGEWPERGAGLFRRKPSPAK